MKYYSALTNDTALEYPPVDYHTGGSGVALAWDVAAQRGLPPEFAQADVLYAEPPFPNGWQVFHDRVGTSPAMPYRDFIRLLTSFMLFRPGVLVLGLYATTVATQTANPTATQRVELHKAGIFANALWYGAQPLHINETTDELLVDLASQFDTVGDFCAGYGNTGRVFAREGKSFVLSDVNPRCVGYIKDQEWAQ